MSLRFKSDRIRDQFAELIRENNKLFLLLVELERYARETLNKDVVLTSILRTKEENDELYKLTPPDKRPKSAPHTTWEAVDLRGSIYTQDEIQRLLGWLNTHYKNANGKPVALYHKIAGNVEHFHIGLYK
jgi:hypothetical protein